MTFITKHRCVFACLFLVLGIATLACGIFFVQTDAQIKQELKVDASYINNTLAEAKYQAEQLSGFSQSYIQKQIDTLLDELLTQLNTGNDSYLRLVIFSLPYIPYKFVFIAVGVLFLLLGIWACVAKRANAAR